MSAISEVIVIDGSRGEGGGQVLRTSLGIAALSGRPTRVEKIRAGRSKPGLMRQHLAAVRAAAAICNGELRGDEIGSQTIELHPQQLEAGSYRFDIGSAGSTSLVLQTILPALLHAKGSSEITIRGGTHNPLAPPFEFLAHTLAPQLARIGHRVHFTLGAHGFMPAGGGELRVTIEHDSSRESWSSLSLMERGAIRSRVVRALIAQIPGKVAVREIDALLRDLGWADCDARPEVISDSRGPGNALVIAIESAALVEVITTFGDKGRSAESVAKEAAAQVRRYLAADAPVGEHLADQLVLPLALAAGGTFRTLPPTMHLRTQVDLVRELLGAEIAVNDEASGTAVVAITPAM